MGRVVVVLGDTVGDGWRVDRLWLGLGLDRSMLRRLHGHLSVEEG